MVISYSDSCVSMCSVCNATVRLGEWSVISVKIRAEWFKTQ